MKLQMTIEIHPAAILHLDQVKDIDPALVDPLVVAEKILSAAWCYGVSVMGVVDPPLYDRLLSGCLIEAEWVATQR